MTRVEGLRARNRAAMEEEILSVARAHLAESGAAALSLRAIARDLGVASSALYRYVRNRDDLLTLLIVAAFSSLGDHVERAHATVPREDLWGRWRAVGTALRDWGHRHPHEYALIFGSPVPDYRAPAEQTNEPGTRVQALLVQLLADARRAGSLGTTSRPGPPERKDRANRAATGLVDDEFFARAGLEAPAVLAGLAAWTLLLGTVSSEIFHQLGDTVADPDAYFDYLLDVAGALVLAPDQ